MNSFNKNVIDQFRSRENITIIRDTIANHFGGNYLVRAYLNGQFRDSIDDFCNTIASELNVSEPIPGIGVRDQVWAFTNQYINDRISFISVYVLGVNPDEDKPVFCIGDGDPTSRATLREQQRPADEILGRWYRNVSTPLTKRDDLQASQSSAYMHNHAANDGDYVSDRLYRNPREYIARPYGGEVAVASGSDVRKSAAGGLVPCVRDGAAGANGANIMDFGDRGARSGTAGAKCANLSSRGVIAAVADDGSARYTGPAARAQDLERFSNGPRASPACGRTRMQSADYRWPAATVVADSDIYSQPHYAGVAGGANYAGGGANGASGRVGALNSTASGYLAPARPRGTEAGEVACPGTRHTLSESGRCGALGPGRAQGAHMSPERLREGMTAGATAQGNSAYNGYPGGGRAVVMRDFASAHTGAENSQLHTGITFSDNSQSGLNAHENYFFNDSFHALNKGGPIAGGAFGYSNEFTNNRLLDRRTFRVGNDGVENGIPFYEKALYNRYYDRDIHENLRASEFDYQTQRNDMGSLYERADMRQRWKLDPMHPHAQYC
jgi:hypothetical protein